MDHPKNVVFDVDPWLHIKPEEAMEAPVSVYVNEFSEEAVKIFLEDITKANNTSQPIIPIYIDSYGGDVYALMAMIDILQEMDVVSYANIERAAEAKHEKLKQWSNIYA